LPRSDWGWTEAFTPNSQRKKIARQQEKQNCCALKVTIVVVEKLSIPLSATI